MLWRQFVMIQIIDTNGGVIFEIPTSEIDGVVHDVRDRL